MSSCGDANASFDNPLEGDAHNPSPTQPHIIVQSTSFSTYPTLSPDDPSILFSDDFSDNYSGWEDESDDMGSKGYFAGSYSILVNEADFCHWSLISRTFGDIAIQVDVYRLQGGSTDEFGAICRLKDDSNFYYAGITSDGYYGIGKLSDGDWVELGSDEWAYDNQIINPGLATNHIRFSCSYENLTLEVNGRELIKVTDPDIRSGSIGLYACAYDEPGVVVLFDNLVVTRP